MTSTSENKSAFCSALYLIKVVIIELLR